MAGTATYVIASQISFSGITFKQQDGVRRWKPRDVGGFSQVTQLGSLSLSGFTSLPAGILLHTGALLLLLSRFSHV